MVVGLNCHKKQHKVEWKLENFNVLDILFNMIVKKRK
jgi:hypothetical protein